MEGYWSETLLFISKTVVILVVVVVLLLIFLAVVKGIVAAAVEAKNKKNNDDDMELRIENYGNLLSGEKEKLENSMIKALDDDVYEVFNKIKNKGESIRDESDRTRVDSKKLIQQGVELLNSFKRNNEEKQKKEAAKDSDGSNDSVQNNSAPENKVTDIDNGSENEKVESVKLIEKNSFSLSVNSDMSVSVTGNLMFIIDFDGSVTCDEVASLTRAVNLLVNELSEGDEVVIRLTSPGGTVNGYGLAAAQLDRLKRTGARLTIAVDQVAASGGYLMASVADKLIAAPFAYIGSIGVVMELPNFNRLMKKYDVDYEQITAGQYKRTVSTFGEITEEAREKCREELKQVHDIFKAHVSTYRPAVDIEKLATGEVWLASEAKKLGLVDDLMSSDEYIVNNMDNYAAVFNVSYVEKKKKNLVSKLLGTEAALKTFNRLINRLCSGFNVK